MPGAMDGGPKVICFNVEGLVHPLVGEDIELGLLKTAPGIVSQKDATCRRGCRAVSPAEGSWGCGTGTGKDVGQCEGWRGGVKGLKVMHRLCEGSSIKGAPGLADSDLSHDRGCLAPCPEFSPRTRSGCWASPRISHGFSAMLLLHDSQHIQPPHPHPAPTPAGPRAQPCAA